MQPIFDKQVTLQKYHGKGGWTYAVIDGIHYDSKRAFGMLRIKGTIDNYEIIQYNLMPMGDGKLFLPIKKEIRKFIKKEAGDEVKIVMYLDDSPVEIPDDIMLCLNDDPIAFMKFNKLSMAAQKMHIDHINEVKNINSRANRIAKLINLLQ
jgi:Domain of unknown function (DUF1905)/Bacteriocin-protection, YdeI or OmpD-Associated